MYDARMGFRVRCCLNSLSFIDDRIGQLTDAFNLDGHGISILQEAWWILSKSNSMWRSGQNDRTWFQNRTTAQEFNQRRYVKDHIVRVPILHDIIIQDGFDTQRVRVCDFIRGD